MSQDPTVVVGRTLGNWANDPAEKDEEDFCISVRDVCKDVRQLIAITELAKVLPDLLEESNFLE